MYKLKLTSWSTKFVKDISCECGAEISVHHIIFECQNLKLYEEMKDTINDLSLEEIKQNMFLLKRIAEQISNSSIYNLF